MTNELAKAVIGYFQKKQAEDSQLSVEESTIFNMAQNAVESYPVVCMSKDDLEDKGFDTSNVTENEMEYMARKMGDTLVEELYWETLVFWAEQVDIPRKECDECEENDDDEYINLFHYQKVVMEDVYLAKILILKYG